MQYQGRSAAVTGGESANPSEEARAPRLLDRVCTCCRFRYYSLRMERAYVGWIRRFILANGKRHPRELGAEAVSAFLTHLAPPSAEAKDGVGRAFLT